MIGEITLGDVVATIRDAGLIGLFSINTFVLWQVYQQCIAGRIADLREDAGKPPRIEDEPRGAGK